MALNSNQKLVTVKAYSRGEPIPLDESSVFETYELAETYASTNPTAYAGQLVTALSGTKYKTYVLQTNEEGGFTLSEASMNPSIEWQTF